MKHRLDRIHLLSQFFRGTRDSLLRKLTPEVGIPYMKRRELDLLEDILRIQQPKRCLEWGSGYSTLYFPRFLSKDSEWHAIEHHPEWAMKIQSKITQRGTFLHAIPAERPGPPWTGPMNDGGYEDFNTYITFPKSLGTFDFILIDGRARRECAEIAKSLLNPGGVVVMHDINRLYYRESLSTYTYFTILEDFRRSAGGLGIASMDREIKGTLVLDQHIELIKVQSAISNFLKMKWLIGKKR